LLGKGKGLTAIQLRKGSKGLRDAAPVTIKDGVRVGTEKRATSIDTAELEEFYIIPRAKAPRPLPMTAVNGMLV